MGAKKKTKLDPILGSSSELEPFAIGWRKEREEKPLKFPMKFKELLRRVIGGRRYPERLHLFRKFWCAQLKIHADATGLRRRENTDEGRTASMNEIIKQWVADGVDESGYYLVAHDLPTWRKENRIQQRRNAAKTRWAKNKMKKSVDATRSRRK